MSKHIYTRMEWRARAAVRAMDVQDPKQIREVFIHHSENHDARDMVNLRNQVAAMRQIQDFHMDGRGWSDIAYHAVVFQPVGGLKDSRAFLGRGADRVPAAQQGHNTNTLAICVYGNGDAEHLQDNTRFVIETLITRLAPGAQVLGGHRQVVATACPGNAIYGDLNTLAQRAGLVRYHR